MRNKLLGLSICHVEHIIHGHLGSLTSLTHAYRWTCMCTQTRIHCRFLFFSVCISLLSLSLSRLSSHSYSQIKIQAHSLLHTHTPILPPSWIQLGEKNRHYSFTCVIPFSVRSKGDSARGNGWCRDLLVGGVELCNHGWLQPQHYPLSAALSPEDALLTNSHVA